jgi:16S rRNA (cytosine967-C5)-methyltransferase
VTAGAATRRAAILAVTRWMDSGEAPEGLLPEGPERGFVMDLVYGVVRWRRALDWILARCVEKPPAGETRAALMLGIYQVLWRPAIPDYAAVHATVEAAKIASRRSAPLVNGVLRTVARRREELRAELESQPVAIRLSHPDVLVRRWTARWDAGVAARLCEIDNQPAETVVACLPGRASPRELAERMQRHGVDAQSHPADGNCLIVPHGIRVEDLPGYAEGLFVLQDPATLAAVRLLNVAPGLRVLDACAAPGGKTVQIAARLAETGRLVAMDRSEPRLAVLRENLARLRLDGAVEVACGDVASAGAAAGEPFDRVLLDVPCSNTGVLRRRPDARWRFTATRLKRLAALQFDLLRGGFSRLAAGGRLVYSTCSLEQEENEQVVARLLSEEPSAQLVDTVQRHPAADGTDGAFAAALERRK